MNTQYDSLTLKLS